MSTIRTITGGTRTPLCEADALRSIVDSKQAAFYRCGIMGKYISSTPDIIGGAPVITGPVRRLK